MSSLLDVCHQGAWLTEDDAIQFLGLSSKAALRDAFREGSLPHVYVEHGKQFEVSHPFNKHRFFFVQKEGSSALKPSTEFPVWVGICESLEGGEVDSLNSATQARIRDYTNYTDLEDAFRDLKEVRGIISSSELSGEDVDDGDDGYQYGSSGGTTPPPSKAVEGEIYTRADGKRVRRVRRSSSTHGSLGKKDQLSGFIEKDKDSSRSRMSGSRSVGPGDGVKRNHRRSNSLHGESLSRAASLSGFLSSNGEGESSKSRMSGSRSVGGVEGTAERRKRSSSLHSRPLNQDGNFLSKTENNDSSGKMSGYSEGEIYIRADGKKVRRVKKSSVSSVASPSTSKNSSLSGVLTDDPKQKQRGSASVAGDQLAVGRESSLTGEIYVRADGKKVRRVKKSSLVSDETVEIITRADGKKVRRIRKTKPRPPVESTTQSMAAERSEAEGSESSTNPPKKEMTRSLSGFFNSDKTSAPRKKPFSGSHSVAGYADSEIYIRADGKKVRRVRKVKPSDDDPNSLAGFLDTEVASKPTASGAATVVGDTHPNPGRGHPGVSDKSDTEIYVRPDGKKVRRIRKTASKPPPEEKKNNSLGGFLQKDQSSIKKKFGGSNSVAGDQIAISKEKSLTGEVYVRADGKKVRRVKKKRDSAPSPGASTDENVEIITRPDGKRVRRIRKTKPSPSDGSDELAGFLESQTKTPQKGSAATVAGGRINPSVTPDLRKQKSLNDFAGDRESDLTKSTPVAANQVATRKDDSMKGEIYIREDGKKVRRVKKITQAQPGDQVEIITRPDGKKVRRIRRVKKPQDSNQGASGNDSSLDAHLQSKVPQNKGSSASVAGGRVEGEIYIRADGKKVRRVRKVSSAATSKSLATSAHGEQYEIYVRPDGKKVRRIRRSALAARKKAENDQGEPSLSAMLSKNEASTKSSSAATVAGDDITGKSSLQRLPESMLSKEAPSTFSGSNQPFQPERKVSGLSIEDEEVATTYRKMLKMGMPDGAVIQKMSVEGVAQHIQDSVLAGEEPAQSPKKVSALTLEEEEIAATYRKMLKMGMPDGAVIQKMSVEGVAQHIQDSVLAGEEPAQSPQKVSALTSEDEEIAATYRKMLKMGMPDGAVLQKMNVDGVAQNIQDSVLAGEEPLASRSTYLTAAAVAASAPVPQGMALVQKDAAVIQDGMVLVPKEQAEKLVPEGMVAIPKDKARDGIPEGYVLVPKDQVRGDPGDDLILVKKDQLKDEVSPYIIFMGPENPSPNKVKGEGNENVDISGANIVSMDNLSDEVKKLHKNEKGSRPRFLLQALPEDKEMEDDFIRKNLLPASSPREPDRPPKKTAPSSSVAEVLAQMSSMGGEFDAEKMQELLEKLETAEKRQKKLEKQLAAAGVAIAEDIDYDICVKKVEAIGKRMNEIGGSDVTHPDKEEQNRLREEYFKLEQEMDKYSSAMLITDEYLAEQARIEKKWEDDNGPANLAALKKLRRHMPVEVRNMSEAQLTNEPTPNGKYLPKAIAKKFKRSNVLQLIRRNPDDIVSMHPATLENMRVASLTLTERRAVYEHLKTCGPKWFAQKAEKMTERKWTWYKMMKDNFKENVAIWDRHVAQYGPPGAHPYATRANPHEGCPLIGKQCPLKADKVIDYDKEDYGYTDKAVYEVSEVRKADVDDQGAKAKAEALALMKEKKANERSDTLKKHYKGKLLQVAKANGSCESMDEIVDKIEFGMTSWIEEMIENGNDVSKLTDDNKKKEVVKINNVLSEIKSPILDICGRSGMQLSGKKTNDEKPDPRSIVECSLSLEVIESFDVFAKYVKDRLQELGMADTRIKSTISMLKNFLDELNERNYKTLKSASWQRLPRSRKLLTRKDIEDEIKKKKMESEPDVVEEAGGPPLPGPPRGGLMDAIKGGRGGGRGGLLDAIQGRGRGRGGRGDGGRGGLLDAIQGRGRGGRGRGGGRGGLLDAIQGRGRGGRGGEGGRGGLLDAIKGRGRGRGRGGDGGRGGLLDAIKGRGRGDGGRGGLMDAIKARGAS